MCKSQGGLSANAELPIFSKGSTINHCSDPAQKKNHSRGVSEKKKHSDTHKIKGAILAPEKELLLRNYPGRQEVHIKCTLLYHGV